MIEVINSFTASSSWAIAPVLAFLVVRHTSLARQGFLRRENIILAIIACLWAGFYVLSSIGWEPFLAVQRPFFRLASTAHFFTLIVYTYKSEAFIEEIRSLADKGGE